MNLDEEAFGMRNGSRNVLSILVGILVVSSAALTFVPSAEAQSMGQLEPPYSDHGLDTDLPPDGLFDYLVVNVSVNVTQPGDFILIAELRDNAGIIYITDAFNFTWLGVGVHLVPLWFTGYAIRLSGVDGPYQVNMGLLNDTFAMIDSDSYVTGPYLAQDFQTTPAEILPPHSDHGLDTDSDTLFNFLVIDVVVNVSKAGIYDVDAVLLDSTGTIFIDFEYNYAYLDVGLQTVELRFTGFQIYLSGFDGPYTVDLELYDDDWNFLDSDTHMTNPYSYVEFDLPPGELGPPHSDYGLDTNANTLFNYLVVDVVVNVSDAGFYEVDGYLYDGTGMVYIDYDYNYIYLDVGLQTVELRFAGYRIYLSGFDGPYMAYLSLFDEDWNWLGDDIHMTQAYLFTDFEQNPPAEFFPPHSDYGLDTDGDTLFDYLVVDVVVNVTDAGFYEVDGDLLDGTGMTSITYVFDNIYLDPGLQTVELRFSGYDINDAGFDGPYLVDLAIYDDDFNWLDGDIYTTGPYSYTEFDPPPGEFDPPHSDYGLDTNGNTLFNYLVVDVVVNVSDAGFYEVDGYLYDGTGMVYIDYDYNYIYLDVGLQTVELRFAGYRIYLSGFDGPYMAYLSLFDEDWNWLGDDIHMTQAYLFTDFEQNPPAEFFPPHSDYGLDTDGDTLFDYLVVDVVVNVTDAGFYEVDGDLLDGTGMTSITYVFDNIYLDPGLQTVELRFSGYDINDAGFDGPYLVDLAIYDDDFNWLDGDIYTTGPYYCTEFDPPPGQFSPPHSDYGLDTDVPTDGYFNFLVLNASVDINESGMFLVYGILFDATMTLQLMEMNFTQLDVGLQTVELRFSGAGIYTSGFDGPYLVMLLLGTFVDEEMVMVDQDFYLTNPYNYTDFQPVNPGMIWGYVYEAATGSPLPSATVQAYNYTYGHTSTSFTGPTGYYEMNLFEGEFYVVMDDMDLQSNLTVVSVAGSTEVTAYLEESPPMSMSSDISFLDWDNLNLSADMTMEEDNQTMRLMIDFMFGNRDGYLDQGELDLFMGLMGGPPGEFDNTTEIMFVDGIHYDLDPVSFQFGISGEGPVDLKAPFSMHLAGNYTSNTTIPVAPSHLIEVNVTYDTDEEVSIGYMNIPATYVLDAFDPVLNVSISGLGTSAIAVDPLGDPDPGDGVDYVWVNLTVTATTGLFVPEVRDVFIDGSSVMTYYLSALPTTFDLTAIVDDTLSGNSNIGGANYTTPTPVSWPGTLMSALDGAFDEPIEDVSATVPIPASPGIHDYYVHAWDSVPTYNESAPYATLTIIDDLPPEMSDVAIDGQSAATYNLSSLPSSVTLTAVVNDTGSGGSDIGGANYTTPAAASWPGTTMQAEDGTFDSPVENVTAQVVPPTQAGTYDYYVYGWDNGAGYNDSAPHATLTIVDDLPPEISNVRVDGHRAVVVKPGTDVVLTAAVDDTGTGDADIGAANYTIGLTDWPGTAMDPADGSFDSAQEDVSVTIDTSGWSEGSYQVCVYASDSVPAHNTTAVECAEIVIDETPPSIDEVLAEPDPQDAEEEVVVSASITDANGISEVRIEIRDPEGSLVGNFSMTIGVADEYEYTRAYDATGTYTFTIWATDEAGNVASESGDFSIRGEASAGFLEQYWWIILIVVIAVVILVALLALRRKPEVVEKEEIPPPPPEEEVPAETAEQTAEGLAGEEE